MYDEQKNEALKGRHPAPDLFNTEPYAKLYKENLSAGFSLVNADSNVNFALSGGEMSSVDASDSGTKCRKMNANDSEYIRSQMERRTDEGKRKFCMDLIATQLERGSIGDVVVGKDMVFDMLDWSKDGAYELSDFIELMKKL